jgi:hypothetical protein
LLLPPEREELPERALLPLLEREELLERALLPLLEREEPLERAWPRLVLEEEPLRAEGCGRRAFELEAPAEDRLGR